jgi:hypothetical protein
MKNLRLILTSVATIASLLAIHSVQSGTSGLVKKMQGPGFEIYNKASSAISVAIIIDGKLTAVNIASNGKYILDIDVNKPVRLGIYNKQTSGISTTFLTGAITPQPDKVYELNAPGKTKYLTWNPAKSPFLYPQTGTYLGLSGKSDSGYPLSSNLSQNQIVLKK